MRLKKKKSLQISCLSFLAGHFSERHITELHSLLSFLLICINFVPKQDYFRRILQTLCSFTQNVFQERKNKNIIVRPLSSVPLLPPS